MEQARIAPFVCECGAILVLMQDCEATRALAGLFDDGKGRPGAPVQSVFLGPESTACEACGKVYELPSAELLDLDRSEFGRWIEQNAAGR